MREESIFIPSHLVSGHFHNRSSLYFADHFVTCNLPVSEKRKRRGEECGEAVRKAAGGIGIKTNNLSTVGFILFSFFQARERC